MQPAQHDKSQPARQRARHDEFVAIGCGFAVALAAIGSVLVYLWFW